jgi:Ser/Thr protein kinase RdoA (MazF antagonist)
MGSDDQGRETFSYIAGEVPTSVRRFNDKQVSAAARLLRDMHDATRGSSLAGTQEVVCHNDLNVRNVVLQDDIPVAWLDFDMAAPGKAITDVAYLAWGFCISSYWPPARSATEQAAQVRVLADAYGVTSAQRAELVSEVMAHQRRIVALADERSEALANGQDGPPAVADPAFWDGVRDWASRDLEFTAQHAPLFRRALRV